MSPAAASGRRPASTPALESRRRRARRLPTDDYEQRRTDLLRAAAQVFRSKGFARATMSDIAARANTDRATAYYYVESKAELFVELTRVALEEGLLGLAAIAESDDSVPAKLRRIIAFDMEQYVRHDPCLHVYAMEDLSRLDIAKPQQKRLAALAQQSFEIVREVVAAGLADGSLESELSPGVIAQTVIGMVAWSNRWYDPARGTDTARLAGDLATIVLNGLSTR
jgi:AcrR family transcriptional regulator